MNEPTRQDGTIPIFAITSRPLPSGFLALGRGGRITLGRRTRFLVGSCGGCRGRCRSGSLALAPSADHQPQVNAIVHIHALACLLRGRALSNPREGPDRWLLTLAKSEADHLPDVSDQGVIQGLNECGDALIIGTAIGVCMSTELLDACKQAIEPKKLSVSVSKTPLQGDVLGRISLLLEGDG